MNRAIEFYLETRHSTIKSLPLKNDSSCESRDEIDHRYQYGYRHLPESHLDVGFITTEVRLVWIAGGGGRECTCLKMHTYPKAF